MNWKKLEDWFVESAATPIVRAISGVVGFVIVIIGGPRIFYVRHGRNLVESIDGAFYVWIAVAIAVGIAFAIVGPRMLHQVVDSFNERN